MAKGLEFHTVIIAGLSEKIFPSARSLEERREEALEEERRLCYVAMTRAKKQLYMTESEGFGFRGYMKTPSRFLFDISNEHITRIGHIGEYHGGTCPANCHPQTVCDRAICQWEQPSGTRHSARTSLKQQMKTQGHI